MALACLGSVCFGLVIAWLSLLVGRGSRRRLPRALFAAALFAGGLLLTRVVGSPSALLVGIALGAGTWICCVRGLRQVGSNPHVD